MNKNNPIALVTGASSGIGEACARALASRAYRLILCGRNPERLRAVADELAKTTSVQTLLFDVRDRRAVESAIASLPRTGKL